MSHIVVLGAGLGGIIMAYEMKDKLGPRRHAHGRQSRHDLLLRPVQPVGRGRLARSARTSPSSWRRSSAKRGIALRPEGARRVHPEENRIELNDGSFARLRLSHHRHRAGPRLRRDRRARPGGQHPVDLPRRPRREGARPPSTRLLKKPGPDRHRRRAGRLLLTARPTNSPSSSTPRCAAPRCATRCR